MRDASGKDYDDFTLLEREEAEISGSLSPFTFLCVSAVLVLLGLIMAYSASYDTALREGYEHYHYLLEMVIFGILGLISGTVLFFMPRKRLEKLFLFLLPLSFVLLLINVLQRFNVSFLAGFPSLSGSDALILSTILALSYLLPELREREMRGYFYILIFFASLVINVLMAISEGFSYSLLFTFTLIVLFIKAKMEKRFIFFYSLFTLTILLFLVLSSGDALSRVFSRLMPEAVEGYDALKTELSIRSIGEGGLIGKGLGQSYYKMGLLEGAKDVYIFSIITEELGLLAFLVILFLAFLFFFLSIRCADRAKRKGDDYIGILSISLSFSIVFKILLSSAAASALLPTSAISMPFFSANGFSYFITIVECSLLYRAMHVTGRGYEKRRD